jgi:hypothetical protein
LLERACAHEGYRTLQLFFSEVRNYPKPDGMVSVGFSESGDMTLFHESVSRAKFKIVRQLKDWRDGYNCHDFRDGACQGFCPWQLMAS